MGAEVTALRAMKELRAQIEERILCSEDYRALQALDLAIADVSAPDALSRAAQAVDDAASELIRAAPPTRTPLPRPNKLPPAATLGTDPRSHAGLMQRLKASFPGVQGTTAVVSPSAASA